MARQNMYSGVSELQYQPPNVFTCSNIRNTIEVFFNIFSQGFFIFRHKVVPRFKNQVSIQVILNLINFATTPCSRLIFLRLLYLNEFCCLVPLPYDLSFASTETKFQNPITKTQNNIVIFGIFHKKMTLSFWLFLK